MFYSDLWVKVVFTYMQCNNVSDEAKQKRQIIETEKTWFSLQLTWFSNRNAPYIFAAYRGSQEGSTIYKLSPV